MVGGRGLFRRRRNKVFMLEHRGVEKKEENVV